VRLKVLNITSLLHTFDKPETLEDHIDDFGLNCDAKGNVTEDQKRGMFMESLDKPTKRSVKDWLAPALTPRTATCAQIIAKLEEKIKPSVNKFVAWNDFRNRKQQEIGAAFQEEQKPRRFSRIRRRLIQLGSLPVHERTQEQARSAVPSWTADEFDPHRCP